MHVVFDAPLTSSDIASFTATGDCGPAPSPPCDPKTTATCEDGRGWDVYVPTNAAGSCTVHVVLTDGEVFDDTVSVSHDDSCGVSGYYGDQVVLVSSANKDAGTDAASGG